MNFFSGYTVWEDEINWEHISCHLHGSLEDLSVKLANGAFAEELSGSASPNWDCDSELSCCIVL
jgi:hypothetical protein